MRILETTLPAPDKKPHLNEDHRLEHATRVLEYIRFFNTNAESRANYLIVANSVFVFGVISASNSSAFMSGNNAGQFYLVSLPLVLFLFSICFAVLAILPRTFDGGSPLNHHTIADQRKYDYSLELRIKNYFNAISDVAYEVHVLSRVVNTRFFWVKLAALSFFVGAACELTAFATLALV